MSSKGKTARSLLSILALATLVLVVWMVWNQELPQEEQAPQDTSEGSVATSPPDAPKQPIDNAPAPTSVPEHPTEAPITQKATKTAIEANEAIAAYDAGMAALKENKFIEARSKLSAAYFSGELSDERSDQLRRTLTELAEMTLIGAHSTVYPSDPYAFYYEFQPGEVLAKVERKLALHVPWQIILKINALARAEDIQAGRPYKMIYGPFGAIINKSTFTMDIYLQRENMERIFIKRMRVGTGKNGSTPTGMWRVRLGAKHERATWYPPPNSTLRQPIPYGEPGYALGAKGLWIGLEGLGENTHMLRDYGIHSTNDPNSIGSAKSLGCIRLPDEDIELAFWLLYEHWSAVEVRQ